MSRRRRLALLLVPIGVFLVLANTGSVLAPSWAHHHPALLLSFDSRNRHLLLTVGGGIAPAAFFVIGFVRLLITDPLFYLLGRWYGDTAIRWFERTTGGANGTATSFLAFAKAGDVLVLIMPNNIVSLSPVTANGLAPLRGARHRRHDRPPDPDVVPRPRVRKPLETVVDWLQRFQWPLIGAFAVIAILNGLQSPAPDGDGRRGAGVARGGGGRSGRGLIDFHDRCLVVIRLGEIDDVRVVCRWRPSVNGRDARFDQVGQAAPSGEVMRADEVRTSSSTVAGPSASSGTESPTVVVDGDRAVGDAPTNSASPAGTTSRISAHSVTIASRSPTRLITPTGACSIVVVACSPLTNCHHAGPGAARCRTAPRPE